MADDVRVKLSAEGVQEVVDAMKRIRDESKRAGEDGAKSFAAFKEAIREVGKELLGFVAIGFVIEKTRELFSEVYNGALTIGKLRDQTGMTVATLQALGNIADDASVSQESLNKGLEVFTRNVGLAEQGSEKASKGFSNLGIRIQDLKNMKPDEQFQLVAQKISGIENASQRAAIGSQVFGKGFAELQPVLKQVADEGVGGTIEKLRALGIVMEDDVIDQMRASKVAMNDMHDQMAGLASQFLTGLMPAASQAMNSMVEDTSGKGVNAFKTLGEWAGTVTKAIVSAFRTAGATVAYIIAEIENAVDHAKDAAKDLGAGAFNTLKNLNPLGRLIPNIKPNTSSDYQTRKEAITQAYQEQLAKIMSDFDKAPELPKAPTAGGNGGGGEGGAVDTALARARLAFIEAQLQAELKLYQANAKLRTDQEKQDYESGTLSLETYYKDRQNILNQQFDKELNILQRRRAEVAALPVDINDNGVQSLQKRTQLAQIDGEIAARKIQQQSELAALATEERQAQTKFYQDSMKAEQQLYTIQGNREKAARTALELELRNLDQLLKKGGTSDADRESALATFRAQGEAKISYDEVKRDADATLKALNTQIAAIQDQVKAGVLFPIQGEQQIMELERQRLPILESTAAHLREIAEATKDPTMVTQAGEFAQKVREVRTATDEAGRAMATMKQTAQDAFEGGLVRFLFDVGTGVSSLSNAFRNMAAAFAESIARMEAEFLAKQFVKWLNGDMGSDNPKSAGVASNILDSAKRLLGISDSTTDAAGAAAEAAKGAADAAANSANAAAITANTTAIAANTAGMAALTTAIASLVTAVVSNTTALSANVGGGGGGIVSTLVAGASALFGGGGGAAAAAAGSGGSAVVGGSVASGVIKVSTGGRVTGPGTSTSDSIPSMLSDGEFVVNAAATAKPGMLALLHAINGTPGYTRSSGPGVRRYAEGGMVAGGGGGVNIKLVNVPDSSLLADHLDSAVGEQQVLNILARNPSRVRQALG